ncbi:hypothetical protein P3L10_000278 [Capsicum annuum]
MNHHNIARASIASTVERPIPRRGQIKSRIAANAIHSIISILSKASSHHHHHRHSIRKN